MELERALGNLGLKGLLLHPYEEAFRVSDPLVEPLVACARAHGVPVLIESGYPWVSEALQIGDLSRRFPDVPMIMTRGGQINISSLGQRNAWLVLANHPNVSIQTSGVYREDFLEEVIAEFGAERVIFGSSAPIMDARLELLRVRLAHVADTAKTPVLGATMLRLLRM